MNFVAVGNTAKATALSMLCNSTRGHGCMPSKYSRSEVLHIAMERKKIVLFYDAKLNNLPGKQ